MWLRIQHIIALSVIKNIFWQQKGLVFLTNLIQINLDFFQKIFKKLTNLTLEIKPQNFFVLKLAFCHTTINVNIYRFFAFLVHNLEKIQQKQGNFAYFLEIKDQILQKKICNYYIIVKTLNIGDKKNLWNQLIDAKKIDFNICLDNPIQITIKIITPLDVSEYLFLEELKQQNSDKDFFCQLNLEIKPDLAILSSFVNYFYFYHKKLSLFFTQNTLFLQNETLTIQSHDTQILEKIELTTDELIKQLQKWHVNVKKIKSELISKPTEITPLKSSALTPKNKMIESDYAQIKNREDKQVEGRIFKISKRLTKNNTNLYYVYISHNNHQALLLKIFDNQIKKEIIAKLQIGTWIRVRAKFEQTKYEKEISGKVENLQILTDPITHYQEKALIPRIEFVNHSKMSAFEGLIEISDLFKLADKYKHPAVVLTDKFNCQNFPLFAKIAEQYPHIKPIYGVQLEKKTAVIEIVANTQKINLKQAEFVIFDIETTGFSCYYDEIIQIGAVKFKGLQQLATLNLYIKIKNKVPDKIVALTGIDDAKLKNEGVDINIALEKMLAFFGDAILIAHNGIAFDLPFLNNQLIKNQKPLINNPLIDTLQLARSFFPKWRSHRLEYLNKKHKIFMSETEHHKADKDVELLSQIWQMYWQELLKRKIFFLDEINTHPELQTLALYEKNYGSLVTIYCPNQTFLTNFYKLISQALTQKKIDLFQLCKQYQLLVTNSPTEGDILKSALCYDDEQLAKFIMPYDFITIAPPSCFLHEISSDYSQNYIEQALVRIIKIAKQNNKKVIASGDSYYLTKEEKQFFEVYVYAKAIGKKNHRFFKKNDPIVIPELFYRNTDEMLQEWTFLQDEALAHEIVVTNPQILSTQFSPIIPIKKDLYPPKLKNSAQLLKKLVTQQLEKLYGTKIHQGILDRIDFELNAIIQNGYDIVYWISHLLVQESHKKGFLVGSRGSVGSSFVAFIAQISEVNPLPPHVWCGCGYFSFIQDNQIASGFDYHSKICSQCGQKLVADGHDIPFETFMGFKGEKVPDIDLNFSALYQAQAHDFIRKKFGAQKVYRAGTINTVAEQTAKNILEKEYLSKVNKNMSEAQKMLYISKCENVKRTTGQHPGGIIVIPEEYDVNDFTPYNFPADDLSSGWYTTHFAFEHLHDSLLKLDILGHDNPTILKKLFELTNVNEKDIEFNDPKVMALFNSFDSLNISDENVKKILKIGSSGIPEFGTKLVKEMLQIIKPQKFSDLIRVSGLSHGTFVWKNNAKELLEKKQASVDMIISCRDDIMVYLINQNIEKSVAFQIMEKVRKGQGLTTQEIELLKKHKVPEWYINSCQKIQYLFPKAHATAYVIMAWKIAWFKIYYPLAFYSAFFSYRSDVFDLKTILQGKDAIIDKLKVIANYRSSIKQTSTITKKDFELVPIYEVALEMWARGYSFANVNWKKSLATEFSYDFANPNAKQIIAPFSSIDGLGKIVAESIVEYRNGCNSFAEVKNQKGCKVTKAHIKKFQELGII